MFTQIDSTRCEIEKFEVFDAVNGNAVTQGSLFDALKLDTRIDLMSGLSIETAVPMTDGTVLEIDHDFVIKATAKGGFEQWKEVNSKIVVCGLETISAVDS